WTVLAGIVDSHIIEVTRRSLAPRARTLRGTALQFVRSLMASPSEHAQHRFMKAWDAAGVHDVGKFTSEIVKCAPFLIQVHELNKMREMVNSALRSVGVEIEHRTTASEAVERTMGHNPEGEDHRADYLIEAVSRLVH